MKKCSFLIFFIFSFVFAQTVPASYQIKWVNEVQGLSNLNVRNVVKDEKGFVWIATDLGLYRYDGFRVQPVKSKQYPQLNSQRIVSLYKDSEGSIYATTSPEEKNYLIKDDSIYQLKPKDGVMLNDFFLKPQDPFFTAYSKINTILKNKTNYFYCLVLPTKDILYLQNGNKIILLKKDGSYSITKKRVDTSVFICNFENVAIKINYKSIEVINSKNSAVKRDKVIQDFIDSKELFYNYNSIIKSDGKYFLNHNSKIYQIKYQNNTLSADFIFELKDTGIIKFSYSQKDNIYFVGTVNTGLAVVYKNNFNSVNVENNNLEYVIVQKGNNIYSHNGWVYNQKKQEFVIKDKTNKHGNFRFLLGYNNNYFYQRLDNELLSIIDLKTKVPFSTSNFPLLSGFTYLNKKLWLTNARKTALLKDNQLVIDSIVTKNLSDRQDINAISTRGDQLIFATSKGVFFHKPFTNQFTYIKGLEKVNARYIKHIGKNSFWVGCYGEGLFLVHKNKTFKVFDCNNIINTTHAIEEDRLGNLWISTNNGLLTFNKKKGIKNILSNRPIACYLYTKEDGLPTNEFNGGSTFPSTNNNGIIGFPSMNGYVWFDPNKVNKKLFKGGIIIDKVVVDNVKNVLPELNKYTINKEGKIVTINFSYGYSCNRANLTIAYRFEDQTNWTDIKGNSFQIGRYKKGLHKLLIRITTHGFNENQGVIKSINLDFEPRYYETFWFWSILFILFLLVLILIFNLGYLIQKNREKQLNIKIEEKTTELVNIVNQLKLSKQVVAKSLHEKNILLKEVHHRVKNNLQLIISMLNIQARRKNFSNIDEFLTKGETRISAMALIHQSLYQSEESLDKINFQMYLQDLINSIRQTFEIQDEIIKVNIEANDIVLNLPTAIPVGLIINELVTNAFKHAFPNNRKGVVSIIIKKMESNKFILTVEDNGIGISMSKKNSKTFGLELINLLATQLKGGVKQKEQNSTSYTIHFTEIIL